MKQIIPCVLLMSYFFASCQGQQVRTNLSGNEPQRNTDGSKGRVPAPYELHGIIDPGMNNMIAFALQTPAHWKMQQSFTRIWNGSTPVNQVSIRITSPDQEAMIEFLPYSPYYYVDGPGTRSLRQTSQAYGYRPVNPGELQPMYPIDYIKNRLLPQLAQRGLQIKITGQKILPTEQTGANSQKMNAYAEGTTANGKPVRVDCIIKMTTTNMNGETYYNWNVFPSVVMSDRNLPAVYADMVYARNSLRYNPSWEKRNSQLVNKGNMDNDAINKRNADMTRDYYNHVQKTGSEVADMRNRSSDKRNEAFGDLMEGNAKYESTETDERVKLADRYNHVYKDRQGNYYGSDEPVNNGAFDWEELQRVETKNY